MANMFIVFSGFRPNDELKKQIEEKLNAKVQSSLSKTTTHLVLKVTTKGSKKIQQAEEAGITIVDIDDFMADNGFVVAKEKKEVVKKVDEEAPLEAVQEAVEEAPQEAAQEVAEEAPKKKKAAKKVKKAAEEAPLEAVEEAPQEAAQEVAEEAPKKKKAAKKDKKAAEEAPKEEVKTEEPAPEKKHVSTAYNKFMKETRAKLDVDQPEMPKKERHAAVLKMWNDQKTKN